MKLTDGKRTVEIIMMEWNGNRWNPDWSMDFFAAGKLANDKTGVYTVEDVYYCIEQAMDWKYNRGDYIDEAEVDPEDRLVIIASVKEPLQYTYCDDVDDKGFTEQHKLYRGIPELNGGWLLQTRGDPVVLGMLKDETIIDKINQLLNEDDDEWWDADGEDYLYVSRWLDIWNLK